MGVFPSSRIVLACTCLLVAFFVNVDGLNTSPVCEKPIYNANVLSFIVIEGYGVELSGTNQQQFAVGSTIIFQCRDAGVADLNGSPEISCLSWGNWSDDAPSCHHGRQVISVESANFSRKVDVNGSLTIFLPPLTSDFSVQITCQVSQAEEPSLFFTHVMYEEGRVLVIKERGDTVYFKERLILNPPRINDSGRFSCQDMTTGSTRKLEIKFRVFNPTTSGPTIIIPTSRQNYERLGDGNLTLTCNVTDALNVWWKHQTWSGVTIVAATSTLHINNISLSDQGSYFCVAKGVNGKIAESKPQTLIIPGFAQLIFKTDLDNQSSSIFSNFKKANFEVLPITDGKNEVSSLHLGKWLNSESNYNAILDEISEVAREYSRNRGHVQLIDFWMHGLSFCIEDASDTSAGILTFPSTEMNSEVNSHELCIAVSDAPRGSRKCNGDLVSPAIWENPVVHNCFKPSATDVADNKQAAIHHFLKEVGGADITSSNASFISRDLADITLSDSITNEDVGSVTAILEKVTKVNSSSATVTNNVIETIDNIVSTADTAQEAALTSETSSSLIRSLEHQLETVKMSGSNFSANRANLAVEVVQIERIESSLTFASMGGEDCNISETIVSQDLHFLDQERIQASVQIPQSIFHHSANCNLKKSGDAVSLPVTFTVHRSGALFRDPQTEENNLIRNSWVVSASTNCKIANLPIASHISTWFSPKLKPTLQKSGKCVFWDQDLNANGGWSSEGCLDQMSIDSNIYKCSCDHMPKFASFAVLMDLKGGINSKALHILTVTGCITSIVGLLITIVSYVSIKKFRKSLPKQIVLNLCFALLGLYCCFLIGINRTKNAIVCVIFGALIHFFCLSVVAWMSVEATQLYLLLVKVVGATVKKFLMKCSLIAWGLPFSIVVFCVTAAGNDYCNDFCFPGSTSYVFYIGVLGLVAVMLLYNVVMYIAIVWNLCVTSKHIAKTRNNKAKIVPRLKNAFAISVLLGLTWLFGFLAIGSLRMTFNILFCLFNSFQGFMIFLLFCARQEEVRAVWGKRLGIMVGERMSHGNVNNSEKPTTFSVQKVTSYDGYN